MKNRINNKMEYLQVFFCRSVHQLFVHIFFALVSIHSNSVALVPSLSAVYFCIFIDRFVYYYFCYMNRSLSEPHAGRRGGVYSSNWAVYVCVCVCDSEWMEWIWGFIYFSLSVLCVVFGSRGVKYAIFFSPLCRCFCVLRSEQRPMKIMAFGVAFFFSVIIDVAGQRKKAIKRIARVYFTG